ncbi:hypothetical protein HNR46_001814 [Haloferula luteola]|uniref:Uncharacterized protein n=1 Tax=Haloferula luteola TaxID=595692 RepID=A0A840UZN9_9BACT|nr:hypothetical protein [Haloferula luteola]MBB5351577.1 hypothetical protein [Haloferula luteola]
MDTIPSDTLQQVIALRAENGLEANESAVYDDLAKSKCKWTLAETPRYRQAGRSPIFISGKYLTATGICPATGEKDDRAPKTSTRAASTSSASKPESKIDETVFYKVLHGKGFSVKITQDLLSGALETQVPASITNLGLKFAPMPSNATDIHVVQTSPQVQVSMPLDKFLELAGIKP